MSYIHVPTNLEPILRNSSVDELEDIRKAVWRKLQEGKAPKEISAQMVKNGWDTEFSHWYVQTVQEEKQEVVLLAPLPKNARPVYWPKRLLRYMVFSIPMTLLVLYILALEHLNYNIVVGFVVVVGVFPGWFFVKPPKFRRGFDDGPRPAYDDPDAKPLTEKPVLSDW